MVIFNFVWARRGTGGVRSIDSTAFLLTIVVRLPRVRSRGTSSRRYVRHASHCTGAAAASKAVCGLARTARQTIRLARAAAPQNIVEGASLYGVRRPYRARNTTRSVNGGSRVRIPARREERVRWDGAGQGAEHGRRCGGGSGGDPSS